MQTCVVGSTRATSKCVLFDLLSEEWRGLLQLIVCSAITRDLPNFLTALSRWQRSRTVHNSESVYCKNKHSSNVTDTRVTNYATPFFAGCWKVCIVVVLLICLWGNLCLGLWYNPSIGVMPHDVMYQLYCVALLSIIVYTKSKLLSFHCLPCDETRVSYMTQHPRIVR